MNKLPAAKRAQILAMLCEGSSMRSVARLADVSINTVSVDAGKACAAHHDETVQGVTSKRVQCDEIWSFCYAKAKNVIPEIKAEHSGAGDVWTWTALDADTKLLISRMWRSAICRPRKRSWKMWPRDWRIPCSHDGFVPAVSHGG